MAGGGSGGTGGSYPGMGGGSTLSGASSAPQWLKGLQMGQQLMASAAPRPMAPPGGGMMGGPGGAQLQQGPPGMPSGAVPGAVPQMPMGAGPPGMATGGMGGMPGGMGGAPMGGMPGGINPQLLQMLMRNRQM